MTTTLRPAGPLQTEADGGRRRRFGIHVNSRPVGGIELGTDDRLGARVARVHALRVEEPDRRRGRATVAVLAAEEVARSWGCGQIVASVPADATGALGLAAALGYVERNRNMVKRLGAAPVLPPGSAARPMTPAEYGPWRASGEEEYVQDWVKRGVPEAEARAKATRDWARLLPQGLDSPGTVLSFLEHEGTPVGTIWTALVGPDRQPYVYDIVVAEEHRGHGHGRSLMLHAEAASLAAGARELGLNVFAGNAPALSLYTSLGYEPTVHHLYKPL
ncbi:GNAT family N-acetyltransferase [Streptomyces sp. JNUCC 64]